MEADLLGLGLNIADWHQDRRDEHGRPLLSSRRLMVMLEHALDDESAFRTWTRDGRQSRATRVREETLNEALRLRSSYETVASHGEVSWDANDFTWLDPIEHAERIKRQAEEEAERQRADEDFYSDMGFT